MDVDAFIGEVRLFPYSFVPTDWAPCDGRVLPIPQYTALFAIVGTTYGGDGRTNFALPNLKGRVVVGAGRGPGLTQRIPGQQGGQATVTLNNAQVAHAHPVRGYARSSASSVPGPTMALAAVAAYAPPGPTNAFAADATSSVGATPAAAHNNIMPYQELVFCIALSGIFPPRQ